MKEHKVTLLRDKSRIAHFDDIIGKKISNGKVYYENLMLNYIRQLGKFKTVLDIGANIGNHSVFFGKYVADEVLAVEPVPNNYDLLCKNVELNNLQNKVKTYNFGLAKENGEMFVENIERNMGACDLVHEGTENHIKVEVRDASKFASRFNLIKIDCESMSFEILKAMLPQIKRNNAHVFIEASPKELSIIKNSMGGIVKKVFNATPTYHIIFR